MTFSEPEIDPSAVFNISNLIKKICILKSYKTAAHKATFWLHIDSTMMQKNKDFFFLYKMFDTDNNCKRLIK